MCSICRFLYLVMKKNFLFYFFKKKMYKYLIKKLFKILDNDFIQFFIQRCKYPKLVELSLWLFFFSVYFIMAVIFKKCLIILYNTGGYFFIYSYKLFEPDSFMWLLVHYGFRKYIDMNLKDLYLTIIFADIILSWLSFVLEVPIVQYYIYYVYLFLEALILTLIGIYVDLFFIIVVAIIEIIEEFYKIFLYFIKKVIKIFSYFIKKVRNFIEIIFIRPLVLKIFKTYIKYLQFLKREKEKEKEKEK